MYEIQQIITKGENVVEKNIYSWYSQAEENNLDQAPVVQLDRMFGYEPKGRGFESLPA